MDVRLRHVAQVNPATPAFDRLRDEDELTFLPMEAVWPNERLDISRRRPKSSVSTGYTRFQDGDVLVPKITPTFEAGRAVLIRGLLGGVGAGTTELHVLRAGRRIDARFLFYVVNTRDFLNLGEAEMYGVAGQQRVPDNFLRDLPVRLPPLDEQRRIVDFLDAETAHIDRLRILRQRQSELLVAYREQRIRHSITNTSAAAGEGKWIPWLGSVSPDWPVVNLNRIGTFHMGTTFPHAFQGTDHGDFPFVKVGDFAAADDLGNVESAANWVTRQTASTLGARIIPKDSVLYARVGAALLLNQRRLVMRECIIDDNVRAIHFSSGVSRFWLHMLSLLDLGQLSNPGPVPSVSESQMASVRVPVPSDEEQRRIADEIDAMILSVTRLQRCLDQQLALLAERRQALITAAVTGQLDVTTARSVQQDL